MKFHAFLLLTAGFTAATMLAACQKNGGGKASVRDGRSARAKAGATEPKLESIEIQCNGTIQINDSAAKVVDQKIQWDQKSLLIAPLLKEVDINEEEGIFAIEVVKKSDSSDGAMAIVAGLDKDKSIRAFGTLQSKVKLTLDNKGNHRVRMTVLCAVAGQEKALSKPIKLNDKKADLVCVGRIGSEEAKKDLHAEKSGNILVGATGNESLKYDDLTLGKAMSKASMTMTPTLTADLRKGGIKITLETADKNLVIVADAKNDLAAQLIVSSDSEKKSLEYKCSRPEIATGTIADEAQELGLDLSDEPAPVSDDVSAAATEAVANDAITTTTRQEDSLFDE